MKINVRLLLITFAVIVIISLSSTFIYYSTTTSLLKNQHSNVLLNSNTDFRLAFQNVVASLDAEVYEITEEQNFSSYRLTELDFIFKISGNREIISEKSVFSSNINTSLFTKSFDDFLTQYPNIILKYYQNNENEAFFYGKVINEELLNDLSEKIRAGVVLVINDSPFLVSNQENNNIYLPNFVEVVNKNKSKQNFKVFYKELDEGDFFANIYSPNVLFTTKSLKFVIFNLHTDLVEFREKMQSLTIIIAFAGVLLSLIFILLFTTKIRRQISLLSEAAKVTASGNLSHRVPILSNDELGNLGKVFNDMLEHIQLNKKEEREYSELITIINKTPILKELTDSVLEKIVKTTNISFGVFYLVEKKNAKPISTIGINQSVLERDKTDSFYSDVINNKKTVELTFDENPPIIKTGLAEIKIKYLLVLPIIFNKNILGIIELASEQKPENSPIDYLNKIKYQLAVGLNSALSYEQLENLVNELRLLNDQYQKQNLQISEQNTELIELHNELQIQADELEEQRKKAVELSHVKSQFLANMSHELRTPLNSILGLTELISEDTSTFPKTKARLKIVLRNGKKLLALINNILEFSKIESGKYEVTKSNFVLSEFILDVYNAMEPLVTEKKLNFEVLFESQYDLLINSDRHKLEQILLNLLSNAIKFTEVGGIKIVVTIENISLKISVIDSGIGISDEDQKKIFNEFEQVDLTSSRKYQGAGLGLAICKKYVNLLNGEITVSKNKLSGTTFSISLSNIILEKFTVNKKLQFKNTIASAEQKTKRIVVLGNEENGNNEILSYFGKNNFDVIESNAGIDIVNQLEHTSLDGVIITLFSDSYEDWNLIYKLKKNKNSNTLPLYVLCKSETNNIFYSPLILDFVADNLDEKYISNQIELIDIQYSKVKSIQLICNNNNAIKNSINKVDKNILVTSSNLNNTVNIIEKSNLIIIDATLLNDVVWKNIDEKKIPTIVLLNQGMIENSLVPITKGWHSICEKYNKPQSEIFKIVSEQISLFKKVMNSITSEIENSEEIKETYVNDKSQFKILVVDDDKDTQFTVGEILQNIGCEVFYADNGAECLATLKDFLPDLILLDIMMPIMDGFETIKKIRTDEQIKNIKVYAITAQAMLDDIDIIKNSGFDDLITKPVNASTLSFKIQQAIQKRV